METTKKMQSPTHLIKNHFGSSVSEISQSIKNSVQTMEDNKVNFEAYDKGRAACKEFDGDIEKATNPYEKKTAPFYSWNRGWNSIIF